MDNFVTIVRKHFGSGTRPPGGPKQPWATKEFASACGVGDGAATNWIKGRNLPPGRKVERLEFAFFGNQSANDTLEYAAWRQEFRAAYEAATKAWRGGKRGGAQPGEQSDKLPPLTATRAADPFSKLPVRVPEHFMGREELLAQIAAHFRQAGEGVPPTVILHGMRGVGKTTLAAAYADLHRAEYPVVWSIRAEAPPGIVQDLAELGGRLGWSSLDQEPATASQIVLEHLAQNGRGKLLIYDNALAPNVIEPLLPKGGDCHVIVTSNVDSWRSVGVPVEVDLWSVETGARFLVARSGRMSDPRAARELAAQLEGLPLAHEIAAAYCEHLGVDLDQYLETFRRLPVSLLSDRRHAPVAYYGGLTVANAFRLSISEAEKLHPAALQLMLYVALLGPGPLSLSVFQLGQQHVLEPLRSALQEPEIREVLAALRAFGLTRIEQPSDLPGGGFTTDRLALHRLIRIVTLAHHDEISRHAAENSLIEMVRHIVALPHMQHAAALRGEYGWRRQDDEENPLSTIIYDLVNRMIEGTDWSHRQDDVRKWPVMSWYMEMKWGPRLHFYQ